MVDLGRDRQRTTINDALKRGEASETPGGVALMRRAIAPLETALQGWLTTALNGGSGRRNTAAIILSEVEPALAAYLTIKAGINCAVDGHSLVASAYKLGDALDAELFAGKFEAAEPYLYADIVNSARRRGATESRIPRALKFAEKKFSFAFGGWSREGRVKVGTKLLELFAATQDVITLSLIRTSSRRTTYRLAAGPGLSKWMQDYNGAALLTRPLYMPMLTPPVPWTSTVGGGYSTDAVRPLDLIAHVRPPQKAALDAADLTHVYAALNAVQATPWSINGTISALMTRIWDLPHVLADGLVPPTLLPIPSMPPDIEALDTNSDGRRAWRRSVRDIHMRNVKISGERYLFQRRLNLAKDFRDYAAIYFPHRCDFRGRIYPTCEALSPQGDDVTKALLKFSVGKVVGVGPAAKWFAVHGANLFGFDKVSLEDREAWAFANSSAICASAYDPLQAPLWCEADKPWQFMAWCCEWAQYIRSPETFHSHLPIALDGSCNGLQHFAAMLRDPTAGRAVNLIASGTDGGPNDIYQVVADNVAARLIAETDDDRRWFAETWHTFGIDRKITKRSVMVVPYGGTFKSCMDYTKQAVAERLDGALSPFGKDHNKALGYLARVVWDAMGEIIVSARIAMGFIQGVARVLGRHNLPMTWTSPSGFAVVHEYVDTRDLTIRTRFHGKLMRLKDRQRTDKINVARQASAASPNFVHSLDAAALITTVNKAVEFGITNFAMVHDSYGTHAADTPVLATLLREVFADQYQNHDVLADLLDAAKAVVPETQWGDFPTLPQLGTLDLEAVLDSEYFFA